MPLMKLSYPVNVVAIFEAVIGLANFKLIPVDSILKTIFSDKDSQD